MNTVVQIVIAAILNFLGMAPNVPEQATLVKPEIFIEREISDVSISENGKVWHSYVFKDAGEPD